MPRPLKLVALGLVPVLYAAAGLALKASRGPYWLGTNADPEYAYLFNALRIASGRAPYHIDHPGTPLQMLGAVVLRGVSLVSGRGTLAMDVIARPEMYLTAMHVAILAGVAILIFTAGLIVFRRTGHLGAALLVQAGPWLFLATPGELSRVRPEPLLIALSAVYGAVLLTSEADDARSDVTALGVLTGVGIADKITALPLLLAPLVAFREWKWQRRFIATAAVAFLGGIIAAWPRVLSMGKWMATLAVHADAYGGGTVTVIDTTRYLPSLGGLLVAEPIVALTIAGGALLWMAGGERRVLGAALVVQIAQVLMVAKHPGVHYLAPLSGTLAINVWSAWQFVSARAAQPMRRLAASALAAVFVFPIAHSRSQATVLGGLRDDQQRTADVTQQSPGCVAVLAYGSSSPVFALQFGNLWSKLPDVAATLTSRYPGVVFDRGRLNLRDFTWDRDLDRPQFLRDQPCVLRQAPPLDTAAVPRDVEIEIQYAGQMETIYRLRAR